MSNMYSTLQNKDVRLGNYKRQDYKCRYTEDIQLAKELGVNAFRMSLEWHRIEPQHKEIDMEAVKRCRTSTFLVLYNYRH